MFRLWIYQALLGIAISVKLLDEYYTIKQSENHIPASYSLISVETAVDTFDCARRCLVDLPCRSFGFTTGSGSCLLSWMSGSSVDQLEPKEGSTTYTLSCSEYKGQVFYFPMDTVINSVVVGDLNGTLFNSPDQVTGIRGKGLSFNGIDQWMELGDQAYPCFGDIIQCDAGFSHVLWIKLSADMIKPSGTDRYIFTSGGQTGSVASSGIALSTHIGSLRSTLRVRSVSKIWLAITAVESDIWFHVGVTWEKSGSLKMYIDGLLSSSADGVGIGMSSASTYQEMFIGRPGKHDGRYGEMVIDEWYFWDVPISAEKVKNL